MIDFTCANCGVKGTVEDGLAGYATWCPRCGAFGHVAGVRGGAPAPQQRESRLKYAWVYVFVGFLILLLLPGLPIAAVVVLLGRLFRRLFISKDRWITHDRRDGRDDLVRFASLSAICTGAMAMLSMFGLLLAYWLVPRH